MSAQNTELEPHFYLVDDSKTKIEDLTEEFVVMYREDRGTFLEPRENYIFFDDFKRAYHRFKMIGPSHSLIKRILTDDDKIIKLAKINTIVIPDDEKEVKEVKENKNEQYESDSSHATTDEEGAIKPVKQELKEDENDILYYT